MAAQKVEYKTYYLLDLIDQLKTSHDKWVNNEASGDAPPASFWTIVDTLLKSFQASPTPNFLQKTDVETALEKLRDEEVKFRDADHPIPSASFWHAVAYLFDSKAQLIDKLYKPYVVESIEHLVRMDTPETQICQLYGLIDSAGRPQLDLLAKELKKSGSVIKKDWLPQREKDRLAIKNAYEDGLMVFRKSGKKVPHEDKPVETPPAPETWEQLADMDVKPEQAAKMKHCTEEEAAAKLKAAKQLSDDETRDELDNLSDAELRAKAKDSGVVITKNAPREAIIRLLRHKESEEAVSKLDELTTV